MITFYPRDIEIWRSIFEFGVRGITLEARPDTHRGHYRNRAEFIEFLKEHGVRLDDAEYPLEFTKLDEPHISLNATHSVHQWSLLGWIKDDYR